jgi:hypothetical protein
VEKREIYFRVETIPGRDAPSDGLRLAADEAGMEAGPA